MLLPTVLFLLAGGFTVHCEELEPFNENSISLDGLFDGNFDSISPISAPSPPSSPSSSSLLPTQSTAETTVASPISTGSDEALERALREEGKQSLSDFFFNEVEFPPEEPSEEPKEETRVEVGDEIEREEEGKTGISIYRPIQHKNNEKQRTSGRTGWSQKRKRLVKKGSKIVRAQWTVLPSKISTRRPHFAKKRRILKPGKHVKSGHHPSHVSTSSLSRSHFRPAPLPTLSRAHFMGSHEVSVSKRGESRVRPREEWGPKIMSESPRTFFSRVVRTNERVERGREKQRREKEEQIKRMKNELSKMSLRSDQIQVKSARQLFEVALELNPPTSRPLLNRPRNVSPLPSSTLSFHPLSPSSFSHFSPPPFSLPPRTTLLSSSHRHSLNSHSPPLLLHRLHDGDWRGLQLLHKRRNSDSVRRRL